MEFDGDQLRGPMVDAQNKQKLVGISWPLQAGFADNHGCSVIQGLRSMATSVSIVFYLCVEERDYRTTHTRCFSFLRLNLSIFDKFLKEYILTYIVPNQGMVNKKYI